MILQQELFTPNVFVAGRIRIQVSLNETLTDLKRRGYRFKFRREAGCLYCVELGSWFTPDSFNIDESYHFEDNSCLSGDRIVYAISSPSGLKGFLTDTCSENTDVIIPDWEFTPATAF
jgi:hypothetical protein